MSDDHNPDGWTFASLYKHFSAMAEAAKESAKIALDAAKDATTKAATAYDKRFDSVNEFRNAMKDQQATYADKEQTERRLSALESSRDRSTGKSEGVAWIERAVLVVVAIAGAYFASRH